MQKLFHWLTFAEPSVHAALISSVVFLAMVRRLKGVEYWVAATVFACVIIELIGSVTSFMRLNNLWFYNTMLFPQFILISFTLNRYMTGHKLRRIYNTGGMFLMIMHVANLMMYQGMSNFANFTYIPACAWMAGGCFFFLKERMEQAEVAPFRQLITWFALATLIDYAGSIPIMSLLGLTHYIETHYANRLYQVVAWLYASWFGLITFGLLWTKTSLRSALSSR